MLTELLVVAGATLLVAVVAMVLSALVAHRIGRVNVVDVTWGLALLAVAVVCAVISPTWEAWLLVGLVGVWGARLSAHIQARSRGAGEDPRYEEMLGAAASAPRCGRCSASRVRPSGWSRGGL